jgi:Putative polyhydroxyalkanoic acid system protein (PHA_gran_rgn)
MSKPLVVTISHSLGRQGAKRQIENGIGSIRSQLSAFAMSIDDHWTDDRLDFRLVAVGQVVTAKVEVSDDVVRVEVNLPGMLGMLADKIASRVRDQGTKMLEKK